MSKSEVVAVESQVQGNVRVSGDLIEGMNDGTRRGDDTDGPQSPAKAAMGVG